MTDARRRRPARAAAWSTITIGTATSELARSLLASASARHGQVRRRQQDQRDGQRRGQQRAGHQADARRLELAEREQHPRQVGDHGEARPRQARTSRNARASGVTWSVLLGKDVRGGQRDRDMIAVLEQDMSMTARVDPALVRSNSSPSVADSTGKALVTIAIGSTEQTAVNTRFA